MCTSPLFRIRDFDRDEKTRVVGKDEMTQVRANMLNGSGRKYIQTVPCGNCIQCRLKKAKENAWRCMIEAKQHENNVMITLTYDDESVPHGKGIDENGEVFDSLTLFHRDVELFNKRLRKATGQKIKFYCAGEYGSNEEYIDSHGIRRQGTMRPHYHIIYFGLKLEDMKYYKMSKCEWTKEQNPLYKSKLIDKLWNKGHADLNEVNYETCCYVARYVTKKYKGAMSDEVYEKRGQKPEYTVSSKGLGKQYYEDNKEAFYAQEKIWQKTKKGLIEVKPGRYFDKLMEKDNPERLEEIKKERHKRSMEIMTMTLAQTSLNIDEYREQMEFLMESKNKKLKRQL